MSWSVSTQDTKEKAKAEASRQFDQCASNYGGEGNPERDDILTCKARVLALIDALPAEWDGAKVYCYGSHSTTTGGVTCASFHVQVDAIKT